MDFGSTFTKAALVDVRTGELLATAGHRTTLDTDVLDGWDACLADLVATEPRAATAEVLACSSAGGGLRIAVLGNEELVTAEAGRRVALSSGGRVVQVAAGGLTRENLRRLRDSEPDVLLLVGGTDGGNSEVLLSCASALAEAHWRGPVVVAGNIEAQPEVAAVLERAGTPYELAGNVVPRIGELVPGPARTAIREMFVRHVIGGKNLSSRSGFTEMVRGATPDVVLTAVELLAHGLDARRPGVGDVVVVDVGGATTDVHSVLELDDPETQTGSTTSTTSTTSTGLSRQVVAEVPASRTVEGDLGMRWSAVSTVEAGIEAGLVEAGLVGAGLVRAGVVGDGARLRSAAAARRADPGFLPGDDTARRDDEAIATVAVGVALIRHAGRPVGRRQVGYGQQGRVVESSGRDLRAVGVLVGSGGVLRHNDPGVAARVLGSVVGEATGPAREGRQLPRAPRVVVDHDCVLAAAGLLAADHPDAAYLLLGRLRGPQGDPA